MVFVLAVWFGASQHCKLETAGLLAHQEEAAANCCPNSTGTCETDACNAAESGALRASHPGLALLAPHLVVGRSLFCVVPVAPPPGEALAVAVRPSAARIQPWVPTWHFDRRTVAAPGAPSGLVA